MLTRICQCHVTLCHATHTFVDDIDLDLFVTKLLKTSLDRFKRSLHICFDNDRKRFELPLRNECGEIFE